MKPAGMDRRPPASRRRWWSAGHVRLDGYDGVVPSRTICRWTALGLAYTGLMLAGPATDALAGTTPVALGKWKATTSTRQTFEFKIVQHGPKASCGTTTSARCFYALSYPTIPDPCPNGQSGGGVFGVPNGFVNQRGIFSYKQGSPNSNEYMQFRVVLSGSKGTGTLRSTSPEELGVESAPVCDSGTIKFTAHHL